MQVDRGSVASNWPNQGHTALNATKNTERCKNTEQLLEYRTQARLRLTLSSIMYKIIVQKLGVQQPLQTGQTICHLSTPALLLLALLLAVEVTQCKHRRQEEDGCF